MKHGIFSGRLHHVWEVIMGLFFGKKKRKRSVSNVWVDPTSDEFQMNYLLNQERMNRERAQAQARAREDASRYDNHENWDDAPQDWLDNGWDR